MRPMMQQKPTLFVVGLFHLTGVPSDPGILEALHQEGYTIEAVRLWQARCLRNSFIIRICGLYSQLRFATYPFSQGWSSFFSHFITTKRRRIKTFALMRLREIQSINPNRSLDHNTIIKNYIYGGLMTDWRYNFFYLSVDDYLTTFDVVFLPLL